MPTPPPDPVIEAIACARRLRCRPQRPTPQDLRRLAAHVRGWPPAAKNAFLAAQTWLDAGDRRTLRLACEGAPKVPRQSAQI
jgi:hypothetical protein